MSGTIILASADWHGTQMRPGYMESASADWAGNVADNLGFLWHRQRHHYFAYGSSAGSIAVGSSASWKTICAARGWYCQSTEYLVYGFRFVSMGEEAGDIAVAATAVIGALPGGNAFHSEAATLSCAIDEYVTLTATIDRSVTAPEDFMLMSLRVHNAVLDTYTLTLDVSVYGMS